MGSFKQDGVLCPKRLAVLTKMPRDCTEQPIFGFGIGRSYPISVLFEARVINVHLPAKGLRRNTTGKEALFAFTKSKELHASIRRVGL